MIGRTAGTLSSYPRIYRLYVQGIKMILVTGAAGMLGQSVVQNLVNQCGFDPNEILVPSRSVLDLEDGQSCVDFFQIHKPRVVIHLAAKVMGLQGNLEMQAESLIVNSKINQNLFMAMLKYVPDKVFFAGTAASYPFPYREMPLRESFFLEGDVHDGEFGYAWAKRSAYPWLRILRDEFGVETVYGIFTNLFGPGDRFQGTHTHVIPALIHRASQAANSGKNALEVWGFPSTTRDFLFSETAAMAVTSLLNNSRDASRELLFNIASGVEIPMRSAAEVIAKEFGLERIAWLHDRPIGVQKRYMDVSRLNNLGIYLDIHFEEQLSFTIDWYKNNTDRIR